MSKRARLHTSARYLLITRVCAFSKVKCAFCFKHGIFWKKSSRFLKKQKVGQRMHTVRCLRELRACLCTNAWHSLAAKIIQLAYSMFGGNFIGIGVKNKPVLTSRTGSFKDTPRLKYLF